MQKYRPVSVLASIALLALPLLGNAQTIIFGGPIYTVNTDQPQVEAVVVDNGKIVFAGGQSAAMTYKLQDTEMLDLKGKTMTPGFIEAHGHVMGLGLSKLNLDLSSANNYDEIVQQVAQAAKTAAPGEWILGRGWHQSKWSPQPDRLVSGFQTHHKLSAVSPDNPVYLVHASGHAAMANAKAMALSGVNAETEASGAGEVIKDAQHQPTGILNETAQALVRDFIPDYSKTQLAKALHLSLDAMAKNGITSFQDAGAGAEAIKLYRHFLANGKLTSRLYVMLSGGDETLLLDWYRRGPEIGSGDNHLTIRAIKLVADGALGSRGAWLIEPYSDRAGHYGLPTMPIEYVTKVSEQAFAYQFQVGVHAIGDRANREMLNVFQQVFANKNQGVRFRIEHAQHINSADIERFANLGVIASMQGVHMSSDRPWAIDRLGKARIEDGAYVWRKLLDAGVKVINGTDVPVEPINPIASYYALVSRKTLAGFPEGGFEPGQKLTRTEALKAYTLDAAYGAFEEGIKGSIEEGKLADFTIFNQDLMLVSENKLLDTKVMMTIVGGKVIYQNLN